MSKEKIETISQGLHRLTQWVMLALLSWITYFLKDMHTDMKAYFERTQKVESKVEVHTAQITNIQQQIQNVNKP